ncbi:sigma-54-dependent Fis family transcriptional regulator [Salicibibacter cibarius]|uniref:Sigma-54-dependent Fis family transcriptional regulator n=1 Tax=Salicibibacter cibarius TaxID=2743000 RepID=A0A7T7CC35_9BACI|nr:sigma-54-dependent Fis family transcriptional regulator [Salicibibacter cibarius]QQK76490.1 sigma-54-dependent Fis family transcriptional regulator [Salicibibacter cibarius]
MRETIERSWNRCEKAGLDRFQEEMEKRMTAPQFDKLKKSHEGLLSVAAPIIQDLHDIVYDTGFLTLLTTEEGVVIKVFNDPSTEFFIQKYKLQSGRIWSEDVTGTSAIGLVVHEEQPNQVIGKEHYWERLNGMTCSAAPIKDEEGILRGILNISGPVELVHEHTLGMVVSAAKAIERQYALNHKISESNEINHTLSTLLDVIEDGVLVVNQSAKIVNTNQRAATIIGTTMKSLSGKKLNDIFDNSKLIEAIRTFSTLQNEQAIATPAGKSCLLQVKPVSNIANYTTIVITFREVNQIHRLARSVEGDKAYRSIQSLKGISDVMGQLRNKIDKVAHSDATVLLLGETGSGKEIVAHSIHNLSHRHNEPFIVVNCAALPRTLLESELFGYEGGTFTGGWKDGKPGKFEVANGGTIFLDEIGEMTPDMQINLLRVLQEQMVTRLGGNHAIPVDIRIISATNKDLKSAMENGEFRQDLYYRLNILRIPIPPLRERPEDIEELVTWIIQGQWNDSSQSFTPGAMALLKDYDWPGNVRELENIISRCLIMSDSTVIDHNEVLDIIDEDLQNHSFEDKEQVEDIKRDIFLKAYDQNNGHVSKMANQLGVSRSTVYRWKTKFEL